MSRFVSINGMFFLRKNICAAEKLRRHSNGSYGLRICFATKLPLESKDEGLLETISVWFDYEQRCDGVYDKLVSIIEQNVEIL